MIEQGMVKKRKFGKLLLIDISCLSNDEVLKTKSEIIKRIIYIMKNHIGKENAISQYELFYKVFNIDPYSLDIYKREYYWNVISKRLSELRSSNVLFVINKSHILYVLKHENELKEYKERIDATISALEKSKEFAKEWVREKKWEALK